MVKKLIPYIFIYIFLIGCDVQTLNPSGTDCQDCFLNIDAPDLELDVNGYYHIEFLNQYIQTFSTLEANTGTSYQKVSWVSNKEVNVGGYWTNTVGGNSYTDDVGFAYTTLSVWEILIGDTIKVYCVYKDSFDKLYVDSLGVIVDNEI